jgi:hypothetical protein
MFEVDFHILNQKATPAIYADTLANRPAASFAGRLFVDTAAPYGLYRDTGSAWVQIAGNGGGGSSTGINGLNGTTNIGLGGTLINDTIINGNNQIFAVQNADLFQATSGNLNIQTGLNGVEYSFLTSNSSNLNIGQNNDVLTSLLNFSSQAIQSNFNGGNFGLQLDDSIGKFVLGDYGNNRKYNSIVVNDDTNSFYFTTSYNQANTSQDLFYASNATSTSRFVVLGDFNNYANHTSLIIDDGNSFIKTQNVNGDNGIVITNSFTFIGAQNAVDKLYFSVDLGNNAITSYSNNFSDGLDLDFTSRIFRLGGYNVGSTWLEVNDNADKFTFTTNNLNFTGSSLEDPTPGVVATKALLITLNGTQYKINLY